MKSKHALRFANVILILLIACQIGTLVQVSHLESDNRETIEMMITLRKKIESNGIASSNELQGRTP